MTKNEKQMIVAGILVTGLISGGFTVSQGVVGSEDEYVSVVKSFEEQHTIEDEEVVNSLEEDELEEDYNEEDEQSESTGSSTSSNSTRPSTSTGSSTSSSGTRPSTSTGSST